MFHGLGRLAWPDSEVTPESKNSFKLLGLQPLHMGSANRETCTYTRQHGKKVGIHHAFSGNRTHDPSVRVITGHTPVITNEQF